jgi:hypothetical protein
LLNKPPHERPCHVELENDSAAPALDFDFHARREQVDTRDPRAWDNGVVYNTIASQNMTSGHDELANVKDWPNQAATRQKHAQCFNVPRR